MTFQRGEIGTCRRRRRLRHRRRVGRHLRGARRHRRHLPPRRRTIQSRSGARRFPAIAESKEAGFSGGEGRETCAAACSTASVWRCPSCIGAGRAVGFEISRQPRVEARDGVVSTAARRSARRGDVSPRGASLRGAGREIWSICRVIESSRWWISATSRLFLVGIACGCS
jgi:hypothetical protein